MQKLDVDYIDFYHFHALSQERWENFVLKYDLLDEAQKAKEEGLIKHISFSFHDEPEVLKQLVDVGIFSSLLCQYNLLDRANEEAIAYAREKGLGVVIMGPVAGGRLALLLRPFSSSWKDEVSVHRGWPSALSWLMRM